MCGIAGFIGKRNFAPSEKKINKCLDLMKTRGPDNQNSLSKNLGDFKLVMLHSRLSIIDPIYSSNQPMEDQNGILSFNGEIYNYIELKNKLGKYKFETQSDSEVLLKYLNKFKMNLNNLDGMWAFSYFDKKKKDLYLVTDRFNEKPLYFYKTNNYIFYGSSPSYIFALSNLSKKINDEKISNFLTFGFKSISKNENTFYNQVQKLGYSTYLKFNLKNLVRKKYWKMYEISQNYSKSYTQNVKIIRNSIIENFQRRYRSDFDIACLLSGGLDSSIIVAIAKKIFGIDLSCFSIKANNPIYDESERIELLKKEFKLKHKYVSIKKKDNINFMEQFVKETYSPLNSISYLVYSQLNAEIKRKKFRVLLSGLGGDELFGGYYTHQLNFLHNFKNNQNLFTKNHNLWEKHTKPLVKSEVLSDYNKYSKLLKSDYFNFQEYSATEKYMSKYSKKNKFNKKNLTKFIDFYKSMLVNDLFNDTVPPQLFSSDQVSMFYSIENRSPFLSKEIYEKVFAIPSKDFMKNGYTKSILRDAFRDLLPKKVVNFREKIGFNILLKDCFELNSKKFHEYIFQSKNVNKFINVDGVYQLLKNGKINNAEQKLIFNLINSVILYNN